MPDDVTKAIRTRTFRFDGPTLQMRFNGEIGTGTYFLGTSHLFYFFDFLNHLINLIKFK